MGDSKPDGEIEALRDRVAQLEAQLPDGPSRRQVLAGGGLLAAGGLLGGGASQQVSAQSPVGQVGTSSEPVDVEAAAVNAGSVNTDDLSTKTHEQIAFSSEWGSVQAAIDSLDNIAPSSRRKGKVIVTDKDTAWQETLDVALYGSILEGYGHNTNIEGSGDTTCNITENDVTVQHLWIDNVDSSNDAISTGPETTLHDLDVDQAGRHGIFCDTQQVQMSDIKTLGGGINNNAIQIGSNAQDCQLSNINIDGQNNCQSGIATAGVEGISAGGVTIRNPTITGVNWFADYSEFSGVVRNSGDIGVNIAGDNNTMNLMVGGSTNEALEVSGSNNAIFGRFQGDVVLESGSGGNYIAGALGGTVTDNGAGNDTSNLN